MADWINIGNGAGWLYETSGASNYIVISRPLVDGGETLLWNYTPHSWQIIGGHLSMVLPTSLAIYAISYDQQYRVLEWMGGTEWREIGRSFSRILGGKKTHSTSKGARWNMIYGIHSTTGNIFQYEGIPGTWTEIGGPGFTFTEVFFPDRNEVKLYGLSTDRSGIWEFTGNPHEWRQVGGPSFWIVGGMNGELLRTDLYTGTPYFYLYDSMRWAQLALAANQVIRFGFGGSFFFGSHPGESSIYYIPADRSTIHGLFNCRHQEINSVISNRWQYLGGASKVVTPIVWGGHSALVAVDQDGNVGLFDRPPVSVRVIEPPIATEGDDYFFQIVAEGGTPPYSFVREGGFPPNGTTLFADGRVAGRTNQAGRYGLTVRVADAMCSSAQGVFWFTVNAMRSVPAPPLHPPPKTDSYSRIVIFNCRVGGSDHPRPPVHIYSRNLNTGEDWQDQGVVESSYNDLGYCPDPDARRITFDLNEGVHYIVAVDETLSACDGNPNNPYCNGGHITVQGNPKGGELQWWPAP